MPALQLRPGSSLMQNNKSFTLIELLISVAIFAVIMTVAYSALSTGIFGYRDIDNSLYTTQTVRSIFSRINLDLRNAFAFSKDESKFVGNEKGLEFFTLVDKYSDQKKTPFYAKVSYYLEGDTLMRLEKIGKESLKENSQSAAQKMCENIDIKFEYGQLDANNTIEFVSEWGADNPTGPSTLKLPSAVKITFKKNNADFTRIVYLFKNE